MSTADIANLSSYPYVLGASMQTSIQASRAMIERAVRSAEKAGDVQAFRDLSPLATMSDADLDAVLAEVSL